jgi:hypothetical protein
VAFVFDKDIFAYNLIMKVKSKILNGQNLSFFMLYPLVFELPYSQVIWRELNLADWPQPEKTKILADFDLVDI